MIIVVQVTFYIFLRIKRGLKKHLMSFCISINLTSFCISISLKTIFFTTNHIPYHDWHIIKMVSMVDPHESDVVPITSNHVSSRIAFEFKLIQFVSPLSLMLTNIIYQKKKCWQTLDAWQTLYVDKFGLCLLLLCLVNVLVCRLQSHHPGPINLENACIDPYPLKQVKICSHLSWSICHLDTTTSSCRWED